VIKPIRLDFPIFLNPYKGKDLCYFDNAATTQKPYVVIDAMTQFYQRSYAPVYRSMYTLAEEATLQFEQARATIATFIGAEPHEVIVTKGATEGINFIAAAWAHHTLKAGDEILLTELEHHANLLPWQELAKRTGVVLKFIPIFPDGSLDYTSLHKLCTQRTKLISVTHVSNAIGTHVDVTLISRSAKSVGARIMLDVCQSVAHQRINVQELGVDFLVFSGHKMLGPTGIGILYMRSGVQHEVLPYQTGGGMVYQASFIESTFVKSPHRYEAGTPPFVEAIGLAKAVEYIRSSIDFEALRTHEAALCTRLIEGLDKIPGFTILGPREHLATKGHLVSFFHEEYHPHDMAAYLDTFGICVRSGHYCAQPLAKKLGIDGSVRVSFYAYNTLGEVDACLQALEDLLKK
jgi:cysteine desulfurase/selenocysteine lyase